jgi:bifunctional DNase/RNase
MIEVNIDSIRVSLMSQHRVAILKNDDSDRYLPIWIGPCEADAITVELQDMEMARPLTHDILAKTITDLGGEISHVIIKDLRNDVFYAHIMIDQDGTQLEIDARPSDALALAVRAQVPIYVEEKVMDKASIVPEDNIMDESIQSENEIDNDRDLSAFSDFVDTLDLDELESNTGKD